MCKKMCILTTGCCSSSLIVKSFLQQLRIKRLVVLEEKNCTFGSNLVCTLCADA